MRQFIVLQYSIIFQAFLLMGIINPVYVDMVGELYPLKIVTIFFIIFTIATFFAQLTKKINLITIYIVTGLLDSVGYLYYYLYELNPHYFIYLYVTQTFLLNVFLTSYTAKFKAILSRSKNIDFEQFLYNEKYMMSSAIILGAILTYLLNKPHIIFIVYMINVSILNLFQILNYKNFKKFTNEGE